MAAVIGAVAALGAAEIGKKGSKQAAKNPAADAQAQIAKALYTETDPVRRALIGRSSNFLGVPSATTFAGTPAGGVGTAGTADPNFRGNLPLGGKAGSINIPGAAPGGAMSAAPSGNGFGDVTGTPTYAAYKNVADRTFQRARGNAISTLPVGGGLSSALVNLEGQRADNLTQGAGNIYDAELARAMTLATGQTGTAVGGLGQAASAQALSAQAAAQQNAAKSGALGTGLGSYYGSKNTGTGTTAKPASSGGK